MAILIVIIQFLIHTHILLWWVFNDPKLDKLSRKFIVNPQNIIFVSSASAWETVISSYHLSSEL